MEYIYGHFCVRNALNVNRRKIYQALIYSSSQLLSKPKLSSSELWTVEIHRLARSNNVPIQFVTKSQLDQISFNRPHQNVALQVGPLPITPLEHVKFSPFACQTIANDDTRPQLWLALHELVDPQNLGAILRSAYFFKVRGVIISSSFASPITPAASKASAGAIEVLPNLYETRSMSKFLQKSKEDGWKILGTSTSLTTPNMVDLNEVILNSPSILVIGNEGSGLPDKITKICHQNIRIPSSWTEPNPFIDSLNASVAAAIILNSLARQKVKV